MSSAEEIKVEGANDQNDEWIVQSKPRRLVPQHALSKQDLDADKAKSSAATTATAAETKKKVIRYSKEEMMTYRQPVKMLNSMAELTEILSTERQNPVCFERFEPEDVIRIWNSEKGGPKNLEGGRGRGRGKTFRTDGQGGEQGQQGEWTGPREGGGSGKGGLWDDSAAAGSSGGDGMDLSDFAAMALKFRSEMENMKLNGEGGEPSSLGEDAMTMLADEQNRRIAGALEEDDEPLPDWATDEPVAQPETKRSLLLDTLNIKRQPEAASAPAPAPAPETVSQSVSVTSSYGIGGGLDLNLSSPSMVSSPPPLVPRVEPTEWQYTDPAGQMQGPFPQDTMRAWHEAGYFNADLPIRLRHWQRFHPFQTVFPDFKVAFLSVPQEPGSGSLVLSLQQQQQAAAAAALRQQQEEQRREQERLAAEAQRREAEQRAQQQAMRQAEIARQQEQARQAQLAEQQRQAQQILLQQQAQQQAELEAQRALLEQQRQQQQQKAAAPTAQQPAASPAKPATVAPWANKQPGASRGQDLTAIQQEEAAAREAEKKRVAAEQAKITKGWSAPSNSGAALSLAEIQAQEEEQRRRQQAEAARAASAAAPATSSMSSQLKSLLGVRAPAAPASTASSGPAWGSAAGPAQAKPAASLKEIMQEENSGRAEDTSAPAAVAPAPGGRKPTSWAAKAGSSTFSTAEPAPRVAVRTPPPTAATQPAAVSPTPARAPAPGPVPAAKSSAPKNEKSTFGGKEMSPDMANWCAAQLKRLNGSDDLTLMQFCMSLDSAAEIRQYLSEYLGSSPAVTNFATDFIKYKEGGKKALESSGVALGGAGAPISSANNNNPSNFISAGKKKSGNRNK